MKRLRSITAIATLLSALMLLFVLVCPYTPSPEAVCSASGDIPTIHAMPVLLELGLASALQLTLESEGVFETASSIPQRAEPLQLSCVWLC